MCLIGTGERGGKGSVPMRYRHCVEQHGVVVVVVYVLRSQ